MIKRKLATIGNLTSSWSGRIFLFSFFSFMSFNNSQPYSKFIRSVNDRTKCPVIQTFGRTKPIFLRTLSVDRPLFQSLVIVNTFHLRISLCNKSCFETMYTTVTIFVILDFEDPARSNYVLSFRWRHQISRIIL